MSDNIESREINRYQMVVPINEKNKNLIIIPDFIWFFFIILDGFNFF